MYLLNATQELSRDLSGLEESVQNLVKDMYGPIPAGPAIAQEETLGYMNMSVMNLKILSTRIAVLTDLVNRFRDNLGLDAPTPSTLGSMAGPAKGGY